MIFRVLEEEDKRILEEMAGDFGENLLKSNNGENKVVSLYGTDKDVLDFFEGKLRAYVLERGGRAFIVINSPAQNASPAEVKKIDVGHFLEIYRKLGLNPHYLVDN